MRNKTRYVRSFQRGSLGRLIGKNNWEMCLGMTAKMNEEYLECLRRMTERNDWEEFLKRLTEKND